MARIMMPSCGRFAWSLVLTFVAGLLVPLRADIPPALASAVQQLRAQGSYSWEIINADPGPVQQSTDTRRGRVTLVQQNTSPHVKASRATNGDMLMTRDWSDGLQLETLVTADGQMVTNTPEGWLTNQEVLSAISEERGSSSPNTARYQWLRRADRPDTRRPDEELPMVVAAAKDFEVTGDSYSAHLHIGGNEHEDSGRNPLDVTIIVNLRGGVVRDYQITVQGSRTFARAGLQLPLSDDRSVILTYVPVRRLDVPDEAWAKLKPRK